MISVYSLCVRIGFCLPGDGPRFHRYAHKVKNSIAVRVCAITNFIYIHFYLLFMRATAGLAQLHMKTTSCIRANDLRFCLYVFTVYSFQSASFG